jgi:predicted GH43/DUF377 family glycosyl hydrolase
MIRARFPARAREPIVESLDDWGNNGQFPEVVFGEGLAGDGNHWLFYYCGADK